MPQINRRDGKVTVRCTYEGCDWMRAVEKSRSRQSLDGHVGFVHRRGQGKARSFERVTRNGEVVAHHGYTKRSRENGVRITDGREHPVTTRRIDSSS